MARDRHTEDIIASLRDFAQGGTYLPEQLQNAAANVLGTLYRHEYERTAITDDEGQTESIYKWLKSPRGAEATRTIAETDVSGYVKGIRNLQMSSQPGTVPHWMPGKVSIPEGSDPSEHPFYRGIVLDPYGESKRQRIPIPQDVKVQYADKMRQGVLAFQNAQTGSDLTRLLLESTRPVIAQAAATIVERRGLDPSDALGIAALNMQGRAATFTSTYGEGQKQSSWQLWAAFGARQTYTNMIDEAKERGVRKMVSLDAGGGETVHMRSGRDPYSGELSYIDPDRGTWTFPTVFSTTGGLYSKKRTTFAKMFHDPFGQGRPGYKPVTLSGKDVQHIGYFVQHGEIGVFGQGGRVPRGSENLGVLLDAMHNEVPLWAERRHRISDAAQDDIHYSPGSGGLRSDFTPNEANVAYLQRQFDEREARRGVHGITSWEDSEGNPITGDVLNAVDPRARTQFVEVGGKTPYDDPFDDAGYDNVISAEFGYKERGKRGRWRARWEAGGGPANPMEAFEQRHVTHGIAFRSRDVDLLRGMKAGEELTLRGHGLEIVGKMESRVFFDKGMSDKDLETISTATGLTRWYIKEQLERSKEAALYRFTPTEVAAMDEDVSQITDAEYAKHSDEMKAEAARALRAGATSPGAIAARNLAATENPSVGQFRSEYQTVDPNTAAMESAMYHTMSGANRVVGHRLAGGSAPAVAPAAPAGSYTPSQSDEEWLMQQYAAEEAGAPPPSGGQTFTPKPQQQYLLPAPPPKPTGRAPSPSSGVLITPPPQKPVQQRLPISEASSRSPLAYQSWVSGEASRVMYKGERLRDVVGGYNKVDQSNIVDYIRSQRRADRANLALDEAARIDRLGASASGEPTQDEIDKAFAPLPQSPSVKRAIEQREASRKIVQQRGSGVSKPPPPPSQPPPPPPDDDDPHYFSLGEGSRNVDAEGYSKEGNWIPYEEYVEGVKSGKIQSHIDALKEADRSQVTPFPEEGEVRGDYVYRKDAWIHKDYDRTSSGSKSFRELADEALQQRPDTYSESMVPRTGQGGRSWGSINQAQFTGIAAQAAALVSPDRLYNKYANRPPHSTYGVPHIKKGSYKTGIEELEFVNPASVREGVHKYQLRHNEAGEAFMVLDSEQEGFEVTTSSATIGQAYDVFRAGLGTALTQGIDTSKGGAAAFATVRARIDAYANSYAEQLLADAGDDPDAIRQAQATGKRIKGLVREFTTEALDQLNVEGRRLGLEKVRQYETEQQPVFSRTGLEKMMRIYPELAAEVERRGGAERVMSGPRDVFVTDDGQQIVYGDAGYGGGGGPRGPTDRDSRFGRGIWGGRFGSMLYGAYVGKRLWSWTAGQAIQEAEMYGQYVSSMAPTVGGVAAMGQTGHQARQQLGRLWMAEGAYEQFGGFSSGLYALSGGDTTVPRIAAGLKLVGGLGAAGYTTAVSSAMLANFGGTAAMASGTAMAGTTMLGVAAAGAVGLAGMEAFNAWIKPEGMQDMSYGNFFQGAITGWQYLQGRTRYAKDQGLVGLLPAASYAGQTPEQLREAGYMSREAYYAYQAVRAPVDQRLERLKETTSIVSSITGQAPEELQPFVRQMARAVGGDIDQPLFEEMAFASQRAGMTFGEYGQLYTQTMSAMGLRSGSSEAKMLARQFSEFRGYEEAERFASRQSVYGRYGGMLSSYYSSGYEANRIARKYQIDTMAEAQGIASMSALANMYGIDLGEAGQGIAGAQFEGIIQGAFGTSTQGPATVGEAIAEMGARLGPVRMNVASQAASFLTQYGAPIQQAMGWVEQYGIQDQRQWGRAQSLIQMAGQYTNNLSTAAMGRLTEAGVNLTEYQTAQIGSILQRVAPGTSGDNLASLAEILATSGMSNADMFRLSGMMSGDIKAWSYDAFQRGTYQGRFTDMAGRPIYMSSLNDFMQMSNAQFNAGNPYARAGYDTFGFLGMQSVGDTEAAQAWMQGGQLGREMLHRQRMRTYENQRINLSQEQLTSDIGYTMQMWGLQDEQRALSHQSQLANFAASWRQLEMRQSFGIAQENLSWAQMQSRHAYGDISAAINRQRMDLREYFGDAQASLSRQGFESRQAWQMYNMQYGRENALMQRQWTQQDWQYSDQMRGLSFGWNIEDINEQIRRSVGYQRRQLVKQRDRMVLTHNLEEGHIDDQRERQEEMWAREDEHYEKLKTYTEEQMALEKEQFELGEEQRKKLMDLDREAFEASERYRVEMQAFEKEQFELSKQQREAYYQMEREELARRESEYMQQYALQSQIIELQRQHQREQWDFQQRSLDISRAIADENWKYQLELSNVSNLYSAIVGHFQMMSAYNPTFQLSQLVGFIQQINSLDPYRLMLLNNIMSTMR